MRIIIEQTKTFSNKFKVWREGGMIGPMQAEMGARACGTEEEVLKEVARLLPRIDPEIEKEIDKAEEELLSTYSK